MTQCRVLEGVLASKDTVDVMLDGRYVFIRDHPFNLEAGDPECYAFFRSQNILFRYKFSRHYFLSTKTIFVQA